MPVFIKIGDEYVKHYDRDAHAPGTTYPTGSIETTAVRDRALSFESLAEALVFVREPSALTPHRPDGEPNRPIMAFHLEFVRED